MLLLGRKQLLLVKFWMIIFVDREDLEHQKLAFREFAHFEILEEEKLFEQVRIDVTEALPRKVVVKNAARSQQAQQERKICG